MYGQNSGYGAGTHRRHVQSGANSRYQSGRDFSTGRMEDQLEQYQDPDQEEFNNPPQESTPQQPTPQASREPQHNGSYVVFPPDQAKRDKLLTMANKEEKEYNDFVESRRPGPIHLTPKKLGGQTSEVKARQRQQLTQSQSKYQKQFQRDEYKRRQREEEEAKLQQMKDIQRRKSEKLEEKRRQEDIERTHKFQNNMRKTNREFLDRLSQTGASSSSDRSAWEQDEEWALQQAMKESMQTMQTERKQSYGFYKQQLKEEEERKLQRMKEQQRRKSELLEVKKAEEEEERAQSQQEEQRRVNNAFLDNIQRPNPRQQRYSGQSNTWA